MRPTVIQHLLLGMNAHINLELGISAVDVAPGPALDDLKSDFDEINAILGGLVDRVQDDLSSVFPLLGALDFLYFRFDERAVHGAIVRARAKAWEKAVALAGARTAVEKASRISVYDAETVGLARAICSPDNLSGGPERPLLECVRDPDTVRHIIEALVD